MPIGQVAALMDKLVGTARWQPTQFGHEGRGQLETIGDAGRAVGIIMTRAGASIEQATRYIGWVDAPVILVFQFDEATPATAITQAFPFLVRQFGEGFRAPEWRAGRISHDALFGRARV